MRLANVDDRPVLVEPAELHPSHALPLQPALNSVLAEEPGDPFIAAVNRWGDVVDAAKSEERSPLLEQVQLAGNRLGPPIPRPGKVVGVPVNYVDHQREMNAEHTVAGLGFFLKSPSSVIGPNGSVALPFPHRRTDQEAELGVIIGRRASGVTEAEALDHVFGYTCLVDVTVRGAEERSTRKSFPGFTPIGAWATPASEVADPNDLRIRGWVNDELRQDDSTAKMVYSVAELIEFISSVVTLEVGDVIATGTPAGVGPIEPGDVIRVDIEQVGSLEVPVVASDREPHHLWLNRDAD